MQEANAEVILRRTAGNDARTIQSQKGAIIARLVACYVIRHPLTVWFMYS